MAIVPFLPILSIFFFLTLLKLKPIYSYLLSFVLTVFLSSLVYKMTRSQIITASLDGSIFALYYICFLIFASLFMFNLIVNDKVKKELGKILIIKGEEELSVLLMTLGLGSLLEAFFGFGTSLIIPLMLLIDLGFDKLKSAVSALIAMTIPTSFGSFGMPQNNLAWATGLDIIKLKNTTLVFESIFLFLIPFLIVLSFSKRIKKKLIIPLFILSLLYSASFVTSGIFISEAFTNIASGITVIIFISILGKIWKRGDEKKETNYKLFYPLFFILTILLIPYFIPPLKHLLEKVSFDVNVYSGEKGDITTITPLLSPGLIIFISTLLSIPIFKLKLKDVLSSLNKTLSSNWKTFISMCLILSISKLMKYSSMAEEVASVFVNFSQYAFPAVCPILGALGSIITGSNSSSNILFGPIQVSAANHLNTSSYILSSFNGIGAAIGKIICPQNLILTSSISNDITLKRIKVCIYIFIAFLALSSLICYLAA